MGVAGYGRVTTGEEKKKKRAVDTSREPQMLIKIKLALGWA